MGKYTELGARLDAFRIEKRIKSVRAFAISINQDPSYVDKVFKGTREISMSMENSLMSVYNLNINWVLTGKGEKYRQSPNSVPVKQENEGTVSAREFIDYLKEQVRDKQKLLEMLQSNLGEIAAEQLYTFAYLKAAVIRDAQRFVKEDPAAAEREVGKIDSLYVQVLEGKRKGKAVHSQGKD